jgi:hypothetical protein
VTRSSDVLDGEQQEILQKLIGSDRYPVEIPYNFVTTIREGFECDPRTMAALEAWLPRNASRRFLESLNAKSNSRGME